MVGTAVPCNRDVVTPASQAPLARRFRAVCCPPALGPVPGPVKISLRGLGLFLAECRQANAVLAPAHEQHPEPNRLVPMPELEDAVTQGVHVASAGLASAVPLDLGSQGCPAYRRQAQELFFRRRTAAWLVTEPQPRPDYRWPGRPGWPLTSPTVLPAAPSRAHMPPIADLEPRPAQWHHSRKPGTKARPEPRRNPARSQSVPDPREGRPSGRTPPHTEGYRERVIGRNL